MVLTETLEGLAGAGPSPRRVDLAPLEPRSLDADRERPYWLALSALPGVGPVAFARLLSWFGSAQSAWEAGPALIRHVDRASDETLVALERMRREGVRQRARRLDERLERLGARGVTALEDAYPRILRDTRPHPPVLYMRGAADALDGVSVAVVGTRRPSGYGRSTASEISDELAHADAAVVSGLAIGIDAEAHAAALRAGGRTVAVIPSPLDGVYPPRNRPLVERIVACGGLVVTELPPERPVGRPDFARRNRVMAAASQATVVVEAPNGSGALLTAAAAVDFGREVYAVPGPIDSRLSDACNRLIADHIATLLTSPVALLQQLGVRAGVKPPAVATLSEAEGIILAALLKRSGSIEELIERSRLPTSSVASALTLLEARKLVCSYGGATFHASVDARRLDAQGRAG